MNKHKYTKTSPITKKEKAFYNIVRTNSKLDSFIKRTNKWYYYFILFFNSDIESFLNSL